MQLKFTEHGFPVKKLILDRRFIKEFRNPPGLLLKGRLTEILKAFSKILDEVNPVKLISVGDYVTSFLLNYNFNLNLAVVDFKVERESYRYSIPQNYFKNIFKIYNPPGSISSDSWLTIQYAMALNDASIILVDGEEDLLALPCVLCAPLNSIVVFGVPGEGMMIVRVDAAARKVGFRMLTFFSPHFTISE
ncbi:MAG: GTP-dependent dephospho-CoA kinase family protein [archaeon GB-1867-097]|nr:GTP-dependent dephospho-CoA kinase family protein [Candidatus Culexmicrobium thermophilum]